MNLRKDHYRIDRVVVCRKVAATGIGSRIRAVRRDTLYPNTAAVHGVGPRKGSAAVYSRSNERFRRSCITGVGVRVPFPCHRVGRPVL